MICFRSTTISVTHFVHSSWNNYYGIHITQSLDRIRQFIWVGRQTQNHQRRFQDVDQLVQENYQRIQHITWRRPVSGSGGWYHHQRPSSCRTGSQDRELVVQPTSLQTVPTRTQTDVETTGLTLHRGGWYTHPPLLLSNAIVFRVSIESVWRCQHLSLVSVFRVEMVKIFEKGVVCLHGSVMLCGSYERYQTHH